MRKGSLQLSINAIVILVMAIVLLGLGIAFIRNTFSDFEDIGTVTEQVKNQITEELQSSNKKMSIPTRNLELNKKSDRTVGIGIKNTGNTQMQYAIKVESFDQAGDATTIIPADNLLYDKTVKGLGITDVTIEPLKIRSGTDPGDVIVKATVYSAIGTPPLSSGGVIADFSNSKICGDPSPTNNCWDEYASETFFVTVN